MAKTVASIVGGRPVTGAPGGTFEARDPAHLDEVVAKASLGDAGTFVEACRTAREAQPGEND